MGHSYNEPEGSSFLSEQLLRFIQRLGKKFLLETVQTKNLSRLTKTSHSLRNDIYDIGHRRKSGLLAYNPNPRG